MNPYICKACQNSIVILELFPDSITNEHREGIFHSDFAKFRTNKAKVCSIVNPETKVRMKKDYSIYDPSFVYTVDDLIEATFNPVIDSVCAGGIHYFKTYDAALSWYYHYGDHKKTNGKYIGYHENGRKKYEENYKDGKMEGKQEEWYKNGQKQYDGNYKNGKKDGKHEWWYENGQKIYEENYKDGKRVGKHKGWYENGQKIVVE